jgi:hypothetical protein
MAFIFAYPNSPYPLATAAIIDISRVVIAGTEPTNITYSFTPAPPANLNLKIDPSNGSFYGTTSFLSISPLTTYTVNAHYDVSGNASAILQISVNFIPQFSYPLKPVIFPLNKPLNIVATPLIQNAPGVRYRLKAIVPSNGPSLVQLGLVLDPNTGNILGLPRRSCLQTTYIIEANNSGVTFDASFNLILEAIPAIQYSQSVYSLTQNVGVSILPVEAQPGVTYTLVGCASAGSSYNLPLGLLFNDNTGEISGVPFVLTSYRSYTITGTNSAGSASTEITLNIIKDFLSPPVVADNFSSNTFLTDPIFAMRRKAEIFKYKKNSNNLTKAQNLALLARGNGPAGKRAWGTQGDIYTNPNTSGLTQVGSTLLCNSPIKCSPTSSSDVPGPIMNLCYDPSIPLMGYNAPARKKINIGFKWPQYSWQPGDNGFPNGKAGSL